MRTILSVVIFIALTWASPKAQNLPNVPGGQQQKSVAAQLIGTWRLVSRETTTSTGERIVEPELGAHPVGYFIYDRTGHVAVQMMRENRSKSEMENCGRRNTKGRNTSSI